MKRFVGLPLLLVLACSSTPQTSPGALGAVEDAGAPDSAAPPALIPADRAYYAVAPEPLPSKPMPVLLLLHGYGVAGRLQDIYFGASDFARRRGILLVVPDGKRDSSGRPFWNATPECCDFAKVGVDDVAFLSSVLDEVEARYSIDKKRVFVLGHSNGGFMGLRLACARATRIAGVVSLAGAQGGPEVPCAPTEPVAVLQVHGTADKTVPYAGGPLGGGGTVLGAKDTVAAWAKLDGCGAALEPAGPQRDFDTAVPGAETTLERHACARGAAELWTLVGGAHIPGLSADWLPAALEFLEAHPKP